MREKYSSHFEAFTDGSKCEYKAAAAAFYTQMPNDCGAVRLRDGSSVFSAEMEGLQLALQKFKGLTGDGVQKTECFCV